LAVDGYFLAGDFETAGFGGAAQRDFELEFAADLFAAPDTHFGVGDDFEPLFRYFSATDPAIDSFGIHRATRILDFGEMSSGRVDFPAMRPGSALETWCGWKTSVRLLRSSLPNVLLAATFEQNSSVLSLRSSWERESSVGHYSTNDARVITLENATAGCSSRP